MVVWACTISGLLAILQYLQPPNRSLAWITVLDVGHAPLFGAIALAALQFLLATPLANRSLFWPRRLPTEAACFCTVWRWALPF